MKRRSLSRVPGLAGFVLVVVASAGGFAEAFADDLVVGDASGGPGDEVNLPIGLVNESAVVGLQFDLVSPAEAASIGPPRMVSTTTDHEATSRVLDGRRRLVIASLANMLLPSDLILDVPVLIEDGAPSGGPSIGVENVVFTDADGNAIPAEIVYPPIEQWRRAEFTDEERLDPDVIGDDRDPDDDGLRNLAEFFLGTRPTRADRGGAREMHERSSITSEGIEIAVEFHVEANRDAVVEAVGESSADLVAWDDSDVAVTRTVDDESGENLYRVSIGPSSDGDRRFLRVRFVRRSGLDP